MSAAAQAYLNTRVSAMVSRLLPAERIAALIPASLAEMAERFGLEPLLDESLTKLAKSRAAEQALIQVLFADLRVLIRPMSAIERGLMLAWARKYSLFNLKTLIRGKLYDLDQAEIHANLYDVPDYVRLPDKELFRAENVLELLRMLEHGPYRLIARQAREVFEQKREPFALEAVIDQRYYHELARLIMQFPSDSQQPLHALLGTVLDAVDLVWLLRFRLSYKLSPSETFYYLVPSVRLLHRERLLALVNHDALEPLLAALPAPLDDLMAGCSTIIDVQSRIGTYTAEEIRRQISRSGSGVARALGYLILRERELFMLFSLIQGKLLGLPRELVEIGIETAAPNCPTGLGAAA